MRKKIYNSFTVRVERRDEIRLRGRQSEPEGGTDHCLNRDESGFDGLGMLRHNEKNERLAPFWNAYKKN